MKNKVLIFLIGFIIIYAIIIIYGKNSIKNIDYQKFINEKTYSFISSKNSSNNDFMGMDFESMYNLDNYFIDDKELSLNELENLSDYILIVENNNDPIIIGNGIINNCKILKVIKGNDIYVNNNISIYDLMVSNQNQTALYLGGSTPLKLNDKYIVFIKKTNKAGMDNTYVSSTVNYGHFNLNGDANILKDYIQNSINLKEAANYNHIFSKNTNIEEINKFEKMQQEILDKYKNY